MSVTAGHGTWRPVAIGPLPYAGPVTQPEPKSTAEEPWPVRVVSQKIGAWIARLGWVWVDGQVAQITRRPGSATVFLTLRDPSADLSLTVTAHRDVLDAGAPELAEGARVVAARQAGVLPGRGTLSLRADEIRQVGLGELLARLERLKKLLAAEGLFDRGPQAPAAVPARPDRADHRAGQRRRAGRADERAPPLAGGASSGWSTSPCRGRRAVPQIIDALEGARRRRRPST